MNKEIKRGQIYYADLSPTRGSEQGGIRPVLIVSNNIGNKHSPVVIVAPITTAWKNKLPTHVFIKYPSLFGLVLTEQLRTIDKSRLANYVTTITEEKQEQVNNALIIALEL